MTTIKEVALRAGTSYTTVSHVINNTRYVSEDIRQRVLKAMEELGYQPNALARSLRSGKTHTFGLILPDSSNPFFAEVARCMDREAIQHGYNLILCNTEDDPQKEKMYLDLLGQRRADGVLLLSEAVQIATIRELQSQGVQLVGVVHEINDVEMDTVLSDSRQGGGLAACHLVEAGHRRIGVIQGPVDSIASEERFKGFADALTEAGMSIDPALVAHGNYHPDAAHRVALEWLRCPEPPSAIFACNDLMAMGVLRAAAETGHSVPKDLALVGFDDIELASYTVPALTTVVQPIEELARVSVTMLVQRVEGFDGGPRRRLLPTSLVVRGSSR